MLLFYPFPLYFPFSNGKFAFYVCIYMKNTCLINCVRKLNRVFNAFEIILYMLWKLSSFQDLNVRWNHTMLKELELALILAIFLNHFFRQHQKAKINKLNLINSLTTDMESLTKENYNFPYCLYKIFANSTSNKVLIFKIYEELVELNIKNKTTAIITTTTKTTWL